jgi:transposase-like protein
VKLGRVEVLISQGKSAVDAIRSIGVTDATFYRWRQEYGRLKVDQVKRMKELEAENAPLLTQNSNSETSFEGQASLDPAPGLKPYFKITCYSIGGRLGPCIKSVLATCFPI